MRAGLAAGLLAAGLLAAPLAADAGISEACRKVLGERIEACTDRCIARAKAAVDPEVAARFKDYACARNCSRQEMFEQHGCPEPVGR